MTNVRRAELFTRSDPVEPGAIRAAVEAAAAAGCELVATAAEVEKHGEAGAGLVASSYGSDDTDVCLALGGDGTILQALESWSGTDVPVFGINYGTIGFLAAAERGELRESLARAFAGDFKVVSLPGLSTSIDGIEQVALNDIACTRRPHHRVAELSYRLGGREVGHVRCDGLVASTPQGSTGYNLANGGPILAWGVEGYAVSFISPHTLTARALVVAPDDVLHVINAGERDAVDIALDGVPAGQLAPGAELAVSFVDGVGRLAQLEGATFYTRIRDKFGRLAR